MENATQAERASVTHRRAILDWVVILGFLAAICAPLVDEALRSDRDRGPAPEMRSAAPRARWSWKPHQLAGFPAAFEAWYADRFGLRDKLLRWHSIEKLFLFGVSPTERVVLGTDGWMFYTGDSSVEVYRGLRPFDRRELEHWRTELERHRDELAALGIAYLYVIAPNKESIYPDYMPPRLNRVGPTRLEQLVAHLREKGSDVPFLDLRPALLAARREDKRNDYPYLPYGTHWNGRGMWAGSAGILDALHARFPVLQLRPLADFEMLRGSGNGDTWGRNMYIDDLRPQSTWVLQPRFPMRARVVSDKGAGVGQKVITAVDDPSLPRAFLYHDSFGPCVQPFLAEHFSKLECSWTDEIDMARVAAEKPDVVIQLFVERALFVHPGP